MRRRHLFPRHRAPRRFPSSRSQAGTGSAGPPNPGPHESPLRTRHLVRKVFSWRDGRTSHALPLARAPEHLPPSPPRRGRPERRRFAGKAPLAGAQERRSAGITPVSRGWRSAGIWPGHPSTAPPELANFAHVPVGRAIRHAELPAGTVVPRAQGPGKVRPDAVPAESGHERDHGPVDGSAEAQPRLARPRTVRPHVTRVPLVSAPHRPVVRGTSAAAARRSWCGLPVP